MRAVVQRVLKAAVTVNGIIEGKISQGLLVFLGVGRADTYENVKWLADKVVNLRIFEDTKGKMNTSVADIHGEVLIISQFTLFGDCRKGRRPGFSEAAPPELAESLYRQFVEEIKLKGVGVASGIFQASMEVELVNDGPVTLLLDTDKRF